MGQPDAPHDPAGHAGPQRRGDVLGVLANALGVAGALAGVVTGVVQRNLLLSLFTLTAVLVILAFWLWRRHTRIGVALLALGCLLAGIGLAVAVIRPPTDPAAADRAAPTGPAVVPTTTPAEAPSTDAPSTGTPADGTSPAGTTGGTVPLDPGGIPAKLVDETVVLPRNAAVDVDRPGQRPAAHHVDGATDGFDFYHDWGPVRSDTVQVTDSPNAYPYSGGNPGLAYVTCSADVTKSAYAAASPGGDFCFHSSEGHLGFATITQVRDDKAFVIHVIVWDGAGS
jgi:hypothetical protein